MSAKAGYDFLGTVIAGGIVGFVFDKYFETAPWGIMGFMVLGFFSATIRAQNAAKKPVPKPAQETQESSDPKKD